MSEIEEGMVYIVGAGPGHPDLITRRGHELLWNCNAVVYDDLIPLELVVELPVNIERYYVGKRGGKPSATQDAINEKMLELVSRGLRVVRLKGGDPSIFGRSGEEVTALTDAGVKMEIVPGITAASGAAASVGMPLTDRRASSWMMLVTGHGAVSESPEVPWKEIGGLAGGTLVIYMGVGELEKIVSRLLDGGMHPFQNCMIVENACTSLQRALTSTLSRIVGDSRKHNVKPPALIIIGKTASLAALSKINTGNPLQGKRILITRPASRIRKICKMFREIGAEPLPYPTIQITDNEDEVGWNRFKTDAIIKGGWCVFTSEAGVDSFFDRLSDKGLDYRCMGGFKIAAVGSGTADAVCKHGFNVDLIPKKALVSTLTTELKGYIKSDQVVVRIRGNLGDRSIEDAVRSAGAKVIPLMVYHTSTAVWEPHWKSGIKDNPPDYILFTSGSTVTGFMEILGVDDARELAGRSKIVVIGPSTAGKAREHGLSVAVEAVVHNIDGIIDALVNRV